ncbi:hypothetical protein BpHYR1_037616 [Brachionus plicatilis]|uniref:Uncharacterized protein n=1 Tax=Brachionus plicatilis TaxID=10195 RepID=A0A3M7S0T1_BRAPC|nr:hypothetical protein BpHYR1_037616 [Brachionus plicatilis]
MSIAYTHATDCAHMATTSNKPFIAWININASNPAHVATNDSVELPRSVPLRLRHRYCVSAMGHRCLIRSKQAKSF